MLELRLAMAMILVIYISTVGGIPAIIDSDLHVLVLSLPPRFSERKPSIRAFRGMEYSYMTRSCLNSPIINKNVNFNDISFFDFLASIDNLYLY
jgi:hypothetical protein